MDGTTADVDVANGKVAPGTGGKFDVKLTNDSDVKVHYTLDLKETNTENVPIEYSLDGITYVTAENFASVSAADLAIGSTTQTVSVYWRWAFEGKDSTNYKTTQTDTTDYTLGTASTAPTVKVEVSTVFTQVD